MSNAIADLWRSERGLLCIVIILAATVLAALGNLSSDKWTDFVLYIYGTYVVGKTTTGVVEVIKNKSAEKTTTTNTGAQS